MKNAVFLIVLLALSLTTIGVLPAKAQTILHSYSEFIELIRALGNPDISIRYEKMTVEEVNLRFGQTLEGTGDRCVAWVLYPAQIGSLEEKFWPNGSGAVERFLEQVRGIRNNINKYLVDNSYCSSGGGGSGSSLVPEPTKAYSIFMIIVAILLGIASIVIRRNVFGRI